MSPNGPDHLRELIIHQEQTGLDEPRRGQHTLLQHQNHFAPIYGVISFVWREFLCRTRGKIIAEVLGHLVGCYYYSGECNLCFH